MNKRNLTAALLGAAALLSGAAPLKAQTAGTTMAAAEPAVPNTPRRTTPASLAAPPLGSPDASHIDASAGKTDIAPEAHPLTPEENDGIVATVNDESISDYELRQRMALTAATTLNTPLATMKTEDIKRLRTQILEQLEEEKMKLQEARKKNITVSPNEVDRAVNRLLGENRLTIEQLREILTKAGASEAALRAQITSQLAWQKAVQEEYADRVNITPAQVDAQMARYAEGANKPHYLVAEIFLPVENSDRDAKVQKDAQDLQKQLDMGAPFGALAKQFSQSPTAAAGGEIGWVHEGQLAPELNAALTHMKPNTISAPIRSVGGYYILSLHMRQEPLGTKIENVPTGAEGSPTGSLKLARLLLPLGSAPTKEVIDNAMRVGGQIRAGYGGCEKLAQAQAEMKGSVYMDLGETKLADLSPEIQKALAATKPGEMAAPMLSEAGVELIGRCDARVEVRTAYTMPSREQVESELFDQQISAYARRYARDLKRDADVETR